MSSLRRFHSIWFFLIPLAFLLLRLGGAPLFDVDEGAFSEATREMLAKGDYLSTWLNGNPRFDKPILIYWLQALSVSIFGVTEWAFRLPSVLAASTWCWAIGRFARKQAGEDIGWMACLVALSCLGVQLIGRAATADALLNMFLALILVDVWAFISEENPWAGRRAALWMGLGILTKGPIAILVPGAALLLWSVSSWRWDKLGRLLSDPWSWVLMLGTCVPWYVAAYVIHGDAFIQGFFFRHNIQRFTGTLEGHAGSMFYYVLMVPLFVLPWLAWLGSALYKIRSAWHDPLKRFLWLWAGFVIVFFSFSGTKLPHYALYGCTPLFILIAFEARQPKGKWVALPGVILLALYAAIPLILSVVKIKDGFFAAQLTRLDSVLTPGYFVGTLVALAAAIVVMTVRRQLAWPWWRVGAITLIGNLVLPLWVAPLLGELQQGTIREAALIARATHLPVVQWQTHWPSFSVYLGAATPLRAPLPGELAVTRSDRLPAQGNFDVIYRNGGVALIRPKQDGMHINQ